MAIPHSRPAAGAQGDFSVLVVDDDQELGELLGVHLTARGFRFAQCTAARQALETLAHEEFDALLVDVNMPGMSGLELCERISARHPDLPVVILTCSSTTETAVGALRAGAYDFLSKPFVVDELAEVLGRAARHGRLSDQVRRIRGIQPASGCGDTLIGESRAMKAVFERIARVAPLDSSVLIAGESGTGKELVARALHRGNRRATGPFVGLNCAAVSEPLLESELFGHTRGAFTDARSVRPGLFLQASGGTLFLDEVGELPTNLQPKLLRTLQERTVRAVGSDTEVPCDVRLVSASNRELEVEVERQLFRKDLFYRLNVIQILLPPLRDREGDVLLLAQRFVERFAAEQKREVVGLAPAVAERLLAYDWPGNVRELQNCIESALAFARYELIGVDDLPRQLQGQQRLRSIRTERAPEATIAEVERQQIMRALASTGGNKTEAASILGIHRRTLYRKLACYASGPRR